MKVHVCFAPPFPILISSWMREGSASRIFKEIHPIVV